MICNFENFINGQQVYASLFYINVPRCLKEALQIKVIPGHDIECELLEWAIRFFRRFIFVILVFFIFLFFVILATFYIYGTIVNEVWNSNLFFVCLVLLLDPLQNLDLVTDQLFFLLYFYYQRIWAILEVLNFEYLSKGAIIDRFPYEISIFKKFILECTRTEFWVIF